MSSDKKKLTDEMVYMLFADLADMGHDTIDIIQVRLYGDKLPQTVANRIMARLEAKKLAIIPGQNNNQDNKPGNGSTIIKSTTPTTTQEKE